MVTSLDFIFELKKELKHISYLLINSVVNRRIICTLVGAVWRSATTPQ